MKKLLLIALCILTLSFVLIKQTNAATISLSGPFQVCPGITYTYTASATNLIGASQKGCWEWAVYQNGQWTVLTGSVTCPCSSTPNTTSTSNFNTQWVSPGLRTLRVRFLSTLRTVGCAIDEQTMEVFVLGNPGAPSTGSSGLSFCATNETRTVTIPGISVSCNWNNQYDWTVPAGWSIIPSGGIGYSPITGGIRTAATSVRVTSPSTALATRYNGNYIIRVRTDPSWLYFAESSAPIWIGTADTPGSITGNATPNVGYTETYSTSFAAPGASYHNWIFPYGQCSPCWSLYSQNSNLSISAIVGSSQGWLQVVAMNNCGAGGAAKLYVTPTGNGGCNPCQIAINPNPANKELHVGSGDADGVKEIMLYNSSQNKVLHIFTSEKTTILSTEALPEGLYYIHLISNGKEIQDRVLIKH